MGEASREFNQFITEHKILRDANQLAYRYMSVLKRREAGKTMYNHVFEVARLIFITGVRDPEVIAAAFLHDIIEDSEKSIKKDSSLKEPITREYLKINFGRVVADTVENLTNISSQKLERLKNSNEQKYVLKRMNYVKDFMKHLLDAVKLNVLETMFLVKFFDRYHNMQTLQYHGNEYKQYMIARETFDIYIPLFYMVQNIPVDYIQDMESIAFSYIYPNISENRTRYIENNRKKLEKETLFLKYFIKQREYYDKLEIIPQIRAPYRLHLTKSNFSGTNYAIFDIIVVSDEPSEEEYKNIDKEEKAKIRLETEKRLYNFMVDLIHHQLPKNVKNYKRHYLIQNDAFKYSLNFHYSQAYMKPLPAMRINLYSNLNNFMFQLNLTTKNKLAQYNKRRDIRDWVKTLKSVEDNLVTAGNTEYTYERLKVDFLKPVTLYTPKGDYYHIPQNATLRDFAFKIHSELGIKGAYALVNQIEKLPLNKKVRGFHGNIVEIVTEDNIFGEINFSNIYSEVTLASSEKKIDEHIKKHLRKKFGENLTDNQIKELASMFKKEVEKKFTKRDPRY